MKVSLWSKDDRVSGVRFQSESLSLRMDQPSWPCCRLWHLSKVPHTLRAWMLSIGKRRLWFSPKVSAYLVIAFGVDLAEVVFVQIGQANAGSKL
jgi:hypothetical protein